MYIDDENLIMLCKIFTLIKKSFHFDGSLLAKGYKTAKGCRMLWLEISNKDFKGDFAIYRPQSRICQKALELTNLRIAKTIKSAIKIGDLLTQAQG